MTQAGYVFAGYAATVGTLAAYSLWVVARHRSLARRLSRPVAAEPGGGAPGERGEAARSSADPQC